MFVVSLDKVFPSTELPHTRNITLSMSLREDDTSLLPGLYVRAADSKNARHQDVHERLHHPDLTREQLERPSGVD